MQRGQIVKKGPSWYLRVWETLETKGRREKKQKWHKLAPVNDAFRSKKDVAPLAEEILSTLNIDGSAESGLTFSEFVVTRFLPYIAQKKKPSTLKFYKEAYENHLKDRVGRVRLRDFTTRDAQRVLDSISLSHQSLLRIKTAMSAVFTFARQRGAILRANPVQGSKAEGKKTKFVAHAYSLEEIKHMLRVLNEPARTVVAVAAFTGLRAGEIRGLRWEDYSGFELKVRRAVWRTHVGDTKSADSDGAVPVIPFLSAMLDTHRERVALVHIWESVPGEGNEMIRKKRLNIVPPKPHDYIFSGERRKFALNLDNLARREITTKLGDKWYGWHAFRRGLATNLYGLGIPPKVIQSILRHANVETTQTHYIIVGTEENQAAMDKFSKEVTSKLA